MKLAPCYMRLNCDLRCKENMQLVTDSQQYKHLQGSMGCSYGLETTITSPAINTAVNNVGNIFYNWILNIIFQTQLKIPFCRLRYLHQSPYFYQSAAPQVVSCMFTTHSHLVPNRPASWRLAGGRHKKPRSIVTTPTTLSCMHGIHFPWNLSQ